MIYVGIDIAKTNHYASIVNYSTGEVLESPFLVTNNKQGFDLLYSKIKDFNKEKVLIGLESTAHYGNNLIFYFHEKQFKLGIINPIQTATLRKTRIRKVKNDKVDSTLICEALSLGYYNLLSDYDIKLLEIKSLCRFHKDLKDKASEAKIQLKTYVDQLFPELNSFFKDNLDIKTAHELLKLYQSPEDISKVNLTKLSNLLIKSSECGTSFFEENLERLVVSLIKGFFVESLLDTVLFVEETTLLLRLFLPRTALSSSFSPSLSS